MALILVGHGRVLAGGPAGAPAEVRDGSLVLGKTTFAASTAPANGLPARIVAVEPRSAVDERMLPYRRRLMLAAALTLALAAGLAATLGRPLARLLGEVTRLRFQAQTDALTKLANRRALDERLDDEVARARRLGTSLSFVLADIDSFKEVNDRHGHATGDAVLQAVARVFGETVRELDLAARYGGEELALVLPGTPLLGARRLAERIRAAVEGLTVPNADGEPVSVTVSFGAAAFPTYGGSAELAAAADEALYDAKQAGRNRVVTATARKKAGARTAVALP
jgi:diguanylate cyclase (GGDEF)-like protein